MSEKYIPQLVAMFNHLPKEQVEKLIDTASAGLSQMLTPPERLAAVSMLGSMVLAVGPVVAGLVFESLHKIAAGDDGVIQRRRFYVDDAGKRKGLVLLAVGYDTLDEVLKDAAPDPEMTEGPATSDDNEPPAGLTGDIRPAVVDMKAEEN